MCRCAREQSRRGRGGRCGRRGGGGRGGGGAARAGRGRRRLLRGHRGARGHGRRLQPALYHHLPLPRATLLHDIRRRRYANAASDDRFEVRYKISNNILNDYNIIRVHDRNQIICIFVSNSFMYVHTYFIFCLHRSVSEEERSFALGMQFVIFRLFGYIPAPIVFGNLIDSTCLLWKQSCSGEKGGRCLLYDIEQFRYRYCALPTDNLYCTHVLIFLQLVT